LKMPLKKSRSVIVLISSIVVSRPAHEVDCFSAAPAKLVSRYLVMASIAVLAGRSPFSRIFSISAVVLPNASVRIWLTGMPASVNWRISSPVTLPLACIWPKASEILCICCVDPPAAEE